MLFYRQFIARMHLDRQIATRVNELDEQGKLGAETTIDILTHKLGAMSLHELSERQAFVRTISDHRLATCHSREFPTLADGFIARRQPLEDCQCVTTP